MGLQKIIGEVKRYGAGETACRILYNRTHNPYLAQWRLIMKDRAYRRFTPAQMKEEFDRLYRSRMGEELNIDAPTRFTEKIQWLKLYDCTDEKTRLADKYLVRDWVEKEIGGGLSGFPARSLEGFR